MSDPAPPPPEPAPAEAASRRRSPREFVFEIGIVFIGVIMALAAQQAVDWLHWRAEVADTRAALNAELGAVVGTIQTNNQKSPCEAVMIEALEAYADGRRADNPFHLSRFGLDTFQTSAWEVAKSGQGAAHVPLRARLDYASLYAGLEDLQALTRDRRQLWLDIGGVGGNAVLTDQERRRLRDNLTRARFLRTLWSVGYPSILERAAKLGVPVGPALPPFDPAKDCGPPPQG